VNYRPHPRIDRASHQVERGRVSSRPSDSPFVTFADFQAYVESGEFSRRLKALSESLGAGYARNRGRQAGKSAIVAAITDQALKDGEHVHVATRRGVHCAGGDSACSLPRLRPDRPLILVRVVRTCTAVPSQWNAWTVNGQYLYLRYRSGLGTVDAYDTEDSEQWTQPPDGRVAFFDTGEPYGGDMTLADFCERAGLQLADDAEVTGE
jgi:hypothetical protein